MNKKGVELGMNTIVMAVIAIAVLVVILIIFSGRFGIFSSEISKCEGSGGGRCITDRNSCKEDWGGRVVKFNCETKSEFCCQSPCTLAGGTCDSTSECPQEDVIYANCGDNQKCCRVNSFGS